MTQVPTLDPDELVRMRDQVFFDGADGSRKHSRYWLLLVLSACIAAAGVVLDSTATVIGAMIVAPLMVPILGVVLAIVLADRVNLIRSVILVATGAFAVVVVGYALGIVVPLEIDAATNSEVASRVSPGLLDLVAALATGAVGSVALARSDVSDTLPGVAIAISLVPPLSVAGITAQSGAWDEASGALLLFATNVSAILASGIAVMAIFRVRQLSDPAGVTTVVNRHRAIAVVLVMVAVIAVPLAASTSHVVNRQGRELDVQEVAKPWAAGSNWEVLQVTSAGGTVLVRAVGPLPEPEVETLRRELDDAGLGELDVRLELVPTRVVELGPDN